MRETLTEGEEGEEERTEAITEGAVEGEGEEKWSVKAVVEGDLSNSFFNLRRSR